jgi:hypothetical protein
MKPCRLALHKQRLQNENDISANIIRFPHATAYLPLFSPQRNLFCCRGDYPTQSVIQITAREKDFLSRDALTT